MLLITHLLSLFIDKGYYDTLNKSGILPFQIILLKICVKMFDIESLICLITFIVILTLSEIEPYYINYRINLI